MKQIKTIQVRRDHSGDFDEKVNAALREGWELKERFLAPAADTTTLSYHPIFVAYLEKEVPDAE